MQLACHGCHGIVWRQQLGKHHFGCFVAQRPCRFLGTGRRSFGRFGYFAAIAMARKSARALVTVLSGPISLAYQLRASVWISTTSMR